MPARGLWSLVPRGPHGEGASSQLQAQLLGDAAEVLSPFRDSVVVVGAAALEVALADATSVAITPRGCAAPTRRVCWP